MVGTTLKSTDQLGALKVRWGIGRYSYLVTPGLYAVGSPNQDSPVLVTANYKLTFDTLRAELAGMDIFVLVLETMGINVWCAAGKGTFGTDELCNRIAKTGLEKIVSHRRLIVPQLGAPGVAAHLVKKRTGFRVRYGPIEARDLKQFLDNGNKATAQMRTKSFPIMERLHLVPMELVPALKYAVPIGVVLFALGALLGPGPLTFASAAAYGILPIAALSAAVFSGAVITPALLPFLPGRPFAVKGAVAAAFIGLPAVATLFILFGRQAPLTAIPTFGLAMMAIALSSFAAMNFTGSSTYTSLSGVEKEMHVAVPIQLLATICGIAIWCTTLALGIF